MLQEKEQGCCTVWIHQNHWDYLDAGMGEVVGGDDHSHWNQN